MKNIKGIIQLKKCRICKSSRLKKFLDMGLLPLANGFLEKEDLSKKEKSYPLACLYCLDCSLVQLEYVIDPKIMFENYLYVPSMSQLTMTNFAKLSFYASKLVKLNSNSLVIDIGSNDGSLLKFFKNYQSKVLGVDPAQNLAQLAISNGIPTEVGLFNKALARKIFKKYGAADLITATNVVAHINNLEELFSSLKILLSPNGVFIVEFPYILDLIKKNQFDTIYHEHLSYFGLKSWNYFIEKQGFQIIEVKRLPIHGGSLRIVHQFNKLNQKKNKSVEALIQLENNQGLSEYQTYLNFESRVMELKKDLKAALSKLRRQGKRIVGLGAPAKGNILTNFFDIGTETLDYLVDSTSFKQGLYTPGKHIPVFEEQKLREDKADYALVLAWNVASEIMSKQQDFKKRGGKFIIPVPKVYEE